MSSPAIVTIDQQLSDLVGTLNEEEWKRGYWEQGEFYAREHLMSPSIIDAFMEDVEIVRPKINRNFIPGHKKGGV